jgi:hypothetical protein
MPKRTDISSLPLIGAGPVAKCSGVSLPTDLSVSPRLRRNRSCRALQPPYRGAGLSRRSSHPRSRLADHRRGADHSSVRRASSTIRARRPCQGAEGGGLSHHPRQLQPGDDHDRSRSGGDGHLCRADHARNRRQDHRKKKRSGRMAVLPTMGGQTALNTALALRRDGTLEKYDVEMIGAMPRPSTRPRTASSSATRWTRSGWKRALRHRAYDGRGAGGSGSTGLPAIIRPSFTMGGTGGGVAYNKDEFARSSPAASMPRPPRRC